MLWLLNCTRLIKGISVCGRAGYRTRTLKLGHVSGATHYCREAVRTIRAVSASYEETFNMIHEFSVDIWNRPRPHVNDILAVWLEAWDAAPVRLEWEPFSARSSVMLLSHPMLFLQGRHAPLASFEGPAVWANHMLRGVCVPASWREATQVLLPKDGVEVGDAVAIHVEKLLPMILQCAVWRLIGSVFARRTNAREWVRSWRPPSFHGALCDPLWV